MLTFHGKPTGSFCDGLHRRGFLQAGALAIGGLTLADMLRLQAQGAAPRGSSSKAVIMVYLNGGPSHMDMYDMKPDAPSEYRGEFDTIRSNVPGIDLCELMPMQAKIADKFAIVRNMKFEQQGHTAPELYTGFLRGNRPSMGSVISKLRTIAGKHDPLPPNVYIGDANHCGHAGFLGQAHEPYIPGTKIATDNLELSKSISIDRLDDRRQLLRSFDRINRELDDARGNMTGLDAFTEQALAMVASDRARDAFDVAREPQAIRDKYGRGTEFLQARRLVEAGVPFVTITPQTKNVPEGCNGQWDHHDYIFKCLRKALPQYDQSVYALITDLHERGLEKDVTVCIWGEMGRTPRIGTQKGTVAGRDHWPGSGFCFLAGGGLRTGQIVGATDPRGEAPIGRPNTPQNILATLYHCLGIHPATTLKDLSGRPIYLLDDRRKVEELL